MNTATTNPTGAEAMKTQDQGNNESLVRGVAKTGSGYVALTYSESKSFKTYNGACKWLEKRGYNADGSRR